MRGEVSPMTARVTNTETICIRQGDGEIDTIECLPRLDAVQVIEPDRSFQHVGVRTSLHLWTCPAKAPLRKKCHRR